ncbi:hypothetical protein SAMN05216388_101138 [Halorientalis persicus]|uniref:Uncharacterized protein n=1 Tax=Halorientalis persicus TaxID=1367881 RepID=A0A1H8NTM9_9EURY|nr:hypothetical protein [Halorientalis persicus]SEO32743.1 hypothetical protein SAMN05216388_101138 [Halorientalis persicus]
MSDRLPSDHDAVETHRASLERVGRTDRPKVVVPDDAAVPTDEVVRVVIDGRTCHARIETSLQGDTEITGAYDTPTLARDPGDGENRLQTWVSDADVTVGGSVLLDVVTEGFKYGLRAPGERTVYEATEQPSDSLSSIADELTE